MTTFCTYVWLRRAIVRAHARANVTRRMPSAQNATSLGRFGSARPGHRRAREEEPGTGREEPEDADEVVDRRVVGTLLVVVVELVELRDHDPERQGGDEQEDLHPDAHRARSRIEAERKLGRDEGQHEPQYIGEDQEPDDEPTARPLWRAREYLCRAMPASLPRCRREQRKQGRERAPALTPNGRP